MAADAKRPSKRPGSATSNAAEKLVQEAQVTRSQQIINLIWETTQRNIAYAVLVTCLTVDAFVVVAGVKLTELQLAALMQLNVMGGLVLGFYFGRTNHSRSGGVQSTRRRGE